MPLPHHIDRIQELLEEHGVDAVLLTAMTDIRWACGFTGSNGMLLVRREGAAFLSDGRYQTQAFREVRGAKIHIPGHDLLGYAAETGLLGGAKRVLIQSENVTLAQAADFAARFPDIEWIDEKQVLAHSVAQKTDEEIARIRAAQALTDEVFEHVVANIRPGQSEAEVALEIVYQHLRRGAQGMSFDPIVASGPNAALPHARPSGRALRSGELVLMDFGCFLDGYASDMTRTVALGEPGEEARAVYRIVRKAQEAALRTARSGIQASALDGAAREVIEQAGYGEWFTHSLGHGVGLQVHEWPRVSAQSEDTLPEGAVITLEPGIYLPDRLGVRIEDLVVLRPDGCENLTTSTKELLVL